MSAPGARGFSRGAQGVQVNLLNPRPVSPCAAEGGPPTPQVRLCRNKADGEAPGVGGGPGVKLSLASYLVQLAGTAPESSTRNAHFRSANLLFQSILRSQSSARKAVGPDRPIWVHMGPMGQ